MPSPEGMCPYKMLPIPTDLEIVHVTLLEVGPGLALDQPRQLVLNLPR